MQNLYLRPSCTQCSQLRGARHQADLTIADLWGAQDVCPERDDDTGLSLVMVNTQKGRQALRDVERAITVFPIKTDVLLRYNPSIEQPATAHPKRAQFFRAYEKHGFDGARVMKLLAPPGRIERAARRVAHLPAGALRRLRALIKH